jgi:alkylation response protein AidB-like acyl-CoA dehydrogenase
MNVELTGDRSVLRDMAREFLTDRCPPELARACDEREEFPSELFREMAKLGWQGIPFDARYGGSEGDPLDEAIIVEQLGRAMGPLASAFVISVLTCGKTVRDLGTEEQRERWLPPLISGESMMAFALTEPDAGSDAAAIRSRATRADGGWRLNGQKIFCTGASLSDRLLVMMRTSDGPAKSAIGMFVVDTDTPGVTISTIPKLGLHPYPSCMIFFDDVLVEDSQLLGDPSSGWLHLVSSLNRERLAISAMCTGMAQAALDVAAAYVGQRKQFGVAIGDFQAVRQHLARMTIAVEGARALMLRAATLETAGMPSTTAASAAKIKCTDAAVDAARLGMQVLGGYSYTMEYPMQRFLRDALIHPIAGGSNEIQRNIVAQELLLAAGA